MAEYHYSGFGVPEIDDAIEALADPELASRYARGDSQILGKHAAAARVSYGFAGNTPVSVTWIVSPSDGSGVLIPSATWVFSDSVTLSGSAYLPHGEPPESGVLRSEYGATPIGAVLQIGLYF
jgi:hypothetical protein